MAGLISRPIGIKSVKYSDSQQWRYELFRAIYPGER